MTLPATISVSFDFSQGATFAFAFTLGDSLNGIIGVSQFASSEVAEPVIDLSDVTRQIVGNCPLNMIARKDRAA